MSEHDDVIADPQFIDLPMARVVIRHSDVGVKGAVVIEVNNEPVAQLRVDEVTRRLFGIGRSTTTLQLYDGDGHTVRWDSV